MHWTFDGECDIPQEIIDRVKVDESGEGYSLELMINDIDDPIDVWLIESDGQTWTFQRITEFEEGGMIATSDAPFTLEYEEFHNLHVC